MITCTVCNAINQTGALFCEMCGNRLPTVPTAQPAVAAPAAAANASSGDLKCPTCGRSALPGEAFCDDCGTPLSAAAAPAIQMATPPTPPAQPAPQAAYPPPTPMNTPAATSNCPACGAAVVAGEAFCDNCGAALLSGTGGPPAEQPAQPAGRAPVPPPTPAFTPAPGAQPATRPAPPAVPAASTGAATAQSLDGYHLVTATGTRIALPAKAEAIVGREDAPSNNYPDVDLTPHGALQEGVGRRHARLFVQAGVVQIEDLDSTNGTLVNRQKLAPRQGRVVNVGDELRLGKLVLTLQR